MSFLSRQAAGLLEHWGWCMRWRQSDVICSETVHNLQYLLFEDFSSVFRESVLMKQDVKEAVDLYWDLFHRQFA